MRRPAPGRARAHAPSIRMRPRPGAAMMMPGPRRRVFPPHPCRGRIQYFERENPIVRGDLFKRRRRAATSAPDPAREIPFRVRTSHPTTTPNTYHQRSYVKRSSTLARTLGGEAGLRAGFALDRTRGVQLALFRAPRGDSEQEYGPLESSPCVERGAWGM